MTTHAILHEAAMVNMTLTNEQQWQAVVARDASHDGQFVFAVSSTGVFCRPSCAARRPRRENVQFYKRPEDAERAGYRACLRCKPKSTASNPQTTMVRAVCRFIEQHLDEPLTLPQIAEEFRRSPFHLQRTFKSVLGITPKEYADACRLKSLKHNLQAGHSVTRAMYDAGYSSSSRLYERTASQLGMTPDKYRRGAIAATIRYTLSDSPLGRMLIAATEKGICTIQCATTDDELVQGLMREFPFAQRRRDETGMKEWRVSLLHQMRTGTTSETLPLDIRATAFQRRVWSALQRIPFGETRSYSEVAKAIGKPTAARAVARACATNPVAVAIPCHRVVRESGEMGGYRWGIERKEALLEMEGAGA